METPGHAGAHPDDGHQHGGRKPTETSFIEFCVSLSLEELKNIKIIHFLIHKTLQIAKFLKISDFFDQHVHDWYLGSLNFSDVI